MSPRKYAICFGLLAICLAFAGRVIAADEVYDLRGPAPKKGQVFVEKSKFTLKDASVSLTIADNKLEGKMDTVSNSEKEVEILGVDGRDVVRVRTRVIKDETVRKTSIGDAAPQKETDKKALQGEIVFSELVNKKWKHVLEDTKPDEKQQKELKNFDDPENDDELYPAEKVKVGHAWKIEPSAFKRILGSKFTDATGTGSSKFVRVEKIGDESCAVIETEVDLKGKIKDDDDNDVVAQIKGKVVYHRSIPLGVDMKFTIEGKASFSSKIKMDGEKADISVSGKMTGEGETTIKKR
jgi:hypothetical protein